MDSDKYGSSNGSEETCHSIRGTSGHRGIGGRLWTVARISNGVSRIVTLNVRRRR